MELSLTETVFPAFKPGDYVVFWHPHEQRMLEGVVHSGQTEIRLLARTRYDISYEAKKVFSVSFLGVTSQCYGGSVEYVTVEEEQVWGSWESYAARVLAR